MAELIPMFSNPCSKHAELENEIIELKKRTFEMSILSGFAEQILDSARVWMQMFDRNRKILLWNRAAEQISGYSREEVLYRDDIWDELFEDPVWIAGFFDFLEDSSDPGEQGPLEKTIRCKGGDLKFLQINCIRHQTDDGEAGFIFFGYDITERKRIEQEKENLQQMLLQSEKSRALVRVAKGITHEIANPVSVIRNDIDLLLEYLPGLFQQIESDDMKRKIERILQRDNTAITRISGIISAFKSTYRPESWRLLNLNDEIDIQLMLLNREFKDRITIVKEYREVPDIKCYGNEIGQVLLNLLTNAGESIDGPGTITIETGEEDGMVLARITDSGSGISDKDVQQIFDPYYTTKQSGTGLGLALGREVIDRHGGELSVERTVPAPQSDHGTCFVMKLPQERKEDADV